MDDAKLVMRKAIVLLGHRNTLIHESEKVRGAVEYYRSKIKEMEEKLETKKRRARDINAEIFDVNNVLAAIHNHEPIRTLRSVEFMSLLYNANDYTEADTDLRVGDILAEFQFNGKV